MINEYEEYITVDIKVTPRSSVNKIELTGDLITLKLNSPPVDNKANKELLNYISNLLSIPKSSIIIIKGEKSRNKKIRLNGISKSRFLERIMK